MRLSSVALLTILPAGLLLAAAQIARAQQPLAGAPGSGPGGPGEIRGRLADTTINTPVTIGSVTVLRSRDSAVVAGAFPDSTGSFRIRRLPVGSYTVRVRVIGFAPITRARVTISASHLIVDLATIPMQPVATDLAVQTVTTEREEVTFAPDRNIYSTKSMATASGGTAIDVLRNVPSIEVDATNQVSLRGDQNVVVQINGRPSPLTGEQLGNFLAQLPASAIKSIEVSANPSAKNDPEGAAGLINILLNQEADIGWSGGFTTGTGSTGQASFSGNVGRQSGPLTVFTSYGLYRNHQQTIGESDQTNLTIPVPAFLDSHLSGSSQSLWQNGSFRSEYRLTPHDALSADVTIAGGNSEGDNTSYNTDLDPTDSIIGLYDQYSNQRSHNLLQDYVLGYHRTGDAKSTTLSSEVRFTMNRSSNNPDLSGMVVQGSAATGVIAIPSEQDVTTGTNPSFIFQTDYTKPFSDKTKLEAGFKEILRHTTNDFTAAYFDSTTGRYDVDPTRSTNFDYREQIGAAYAVFSRLFGKVQTQAGVRAEAAAATLSLPDAPPGEQRADNGYTSLFPSGVLAYNFTPLRQLKLSYSRRISRPNAYQLDPVVMKQDARDYFVGNPGLHPQYTDAVELAYQETLPWGTLQLNPYLRNTSHAVRNIQTVDSTGVTTSTYDNVASIVQAGADLNVTYRHGPLTLFTGGSAYRYRSDASNLPGNLSIQASVWSARLSATWKLTPTLDFQGFGNYRSKYATEYGAQDATTYINLALRQKLFNNQGSVTLRVQDPFNMMTFGSVTENPAIVSSRLQNFGVRGVYVSFSRNFGQDLKLRPPPTDDQQPTAPQSPE